MQFWNFVSNDEKKCKIDSNKRIIICGLEVIRMYDINSYKRAVIEKTNLCNDKDYLMRYIERLHYLNKVDLIELEKLPFDEWINEIEDEDNRELFKLLPYLSLHFKNISQVNL